MENWFGPIIVIIAVIAFACYYFAKRSKNRKEAELGLDKALVREAAQPVFGGNGNFLTLYAHWEKRESYGRTVKITYYRYAVTYREKTICIAPLYIDKKTHLMQAGRPWVFTPENLGDITVHTSQKDGAVKRMKIWLSDKQGRTLFQLYVDSENLRSNRYFPVNILQYDECAAFDHFLNNMSQSIAAANPGVKDLIKANDYSNLGIIGAIISVVGAVSAFLTAPAGIILTFVGLVISIVGKVKGGKSSIPLIISIICIVLNAVFMFISIA